MIRQFRCRACGAVYAEKTSDGSIYFHVCAPVWDDKHSEVMMAPNARNELVVVNPRTQAVSISAEGDGVEPIPPNKLLEPSWITALKAKFPPEAEEQDD